MPRVVSLVTVLLTTCLAQVATLAPTRREIVTDSENLWPRRSLIRPAFDEKAPRWLDENGDRIEAHGAGMLLSPADGRWYWYGESHKGETDNASVNCYSAATLAGPWRNEGKVLTSSNIHAKAYKAPYILERPKVLYNANTKKYVMWLHVDHIRDVEFATKMRKPFASEDECEDYFESTGCAWTAEWSCPWQKPGTIGIAGADGSIGYQCCCDYKLWTRVTYEECEPYKGTSGCDWTSKDSCPGQTLGSRGLAKDDRSVDYQCCCDQGIWNQSKIERTLPTMLYLRSSADSKVGLRSNVKAKTKAKTEAEAKARATRARRRERFIGRMRYAREYVFRKIAVATSDSPTGPFVVKHLIRPDGVKSLDLNLWVDTDGTAYLIRSCNNEYTAISRLTDDYLQTTGILSKGPLFEGMAMFRHTNGTLYMMTSHLSGWAPNPIVLFRMDGPNLSDPRWTELGNPTQDDTSFNTQPTFVVQYTTKKNLTYSIYMADNWLYGGRQGLLDASYVWLPIFFDEDGSVHIERLEEWDLEHPDEERSSNRKARAKSLLAQARRVYGKLPRAGVSEGSSSDPRSILSVASSQRNVATLQPHRWK